MSATDRTNKMLNKNFLDDSIQYWLCCGSKDYPHRANNCYLAKQDSEFVRYGTAREHSDWQLKKSSDKIIKIDGEKYKLVKL